MPRGGQIRFGRWRVGSQTLQGSIPIMLGSVPRVTRWRRNVISNALLDTGGEWYLKKREVNAQRSFLIMNASRINECFSSTESHNTLSAALQVGSSACSDRRIQTTQVLTVGIVYFSLGTLSNLPRLVCPSGSMYSPAKKSACFDSSLGLSMSNSYRFQPCFLASK